jgi:arylsulfatase A-like enzyme
MLSPFCKKDFDWILTPNFKRLKEKTVFFDKACVGSMPCIPARRELHTGRYNFLHRSWGPLEPFDFSMPRFLDKNGVHSHLITDHFHYLKAGANNYHTYYTTWEYFRGQSGDPWIAGVGSEKPKPNFHGRGLKENELNAIWQDDCNRSFIKEDEKNWPSVRCFNAGLSFLEKNQKRDNWFLTIETFDPHEPFYAPDKYRQLYGCGAQEEGRQYDWPSYKRSVESGDGRDKTRKEYAALLTMLDTYLGKVLDFMDEHDMWRDTMLIVNCDHGFLLDEHGWWGKCCMPWYSETANIPLFIFDPRCQCRNESRQSLVQTIDLAPTLLDYFGFKPHKTMQGIPLRETIANDTPVRESGLYGHHGSHVCITDGRYVYMRGAANKDNSPLFEYTLCPTKYNNSMIPQDEMVKFERHEGFPFTEGYPLLKIPTNATNQVDAEYLTKNYLWDLDVDPEQTNNLSGRNTDLEKRMVDKLIKLMEESEAPDEQYERLGLKKEAKL